MNEQDCRMTDTTTDDFWKPFPETKWREFAEAAKASELQLKFSVARFNGASATGAAKLAGYSGAGPELRRAGYSALRSTAVQNLLELAAINAPQDAKISDKEIDAKISKLIRSPDSTVSLKAMEVHQRREAVRKEAQAAGETLDYKSAVDDAFNTEGIYAAPVIARGWPDYVLAAPYFELWASFLKKRFPELWDKYRKPILSRAETFKHDADEQRRLRLFDELGDRPELTDEQFRAAIKIKGMATNAA
jgi:hypothetical protein